MRSVLLFFLLFTLALPAAVCAGVIFHLEVTDHRASAAQSHASTMIFEGNRLKVEGGLMDRGRSSKTSLLYDAERSELVVLDHLAKTYTVIDEEAFEGVRTQLSEALEQLEKVIEQLPEEQQEMARNMMEGNLPQGEASAAPLPEIRKTEDRKAINGYPSVRYEVYHEDRQTSELWVTDWRHIEGGQEALGIVKSMGGLIQRLLTSIRSSFGGGFDLPANPLAVIDQLEGFPVVTRELEDGEVTQESILVSSVRRDLDENELAIPPDFKAQSLLSR